MAPAEERRFARRQLRDVKEDIDDLERRLAILRQITPPKEIFDAVRRLIENRVLDLNQFVQADD